MKTTEVISIGDRQAVTSPDEFRFTDATVSIRKEGRAVNLLKQRIAPNVYYWDLRL